MQKVRSAAGVILITAGLCSQPAPREQAGPLPGGAFLLNNGWRIQPAGNQIALGSFPMSSAVSRDGNYLLVLNAGFQPPSISVIETASGRVTASVPVEDAWLGLTFSPQGDRVYVGGGAHASVYEFLFNGGKLQPGRTFAVVPPDKRTPRDFIGDVTFSPDGRLLYAADVFHDSVVVINPQSGMTTQRYPAGRRPYRILFHPDGKSFFVTHWSDGTVGQYDIATASPLGSVRLGSHPTDMVWRNGEAEKAEGEQSPAWTARLFVAAANTNNVYAVGVNSAKELSLVESINVALDPQQPLGMTPSGLALSPDAKRLYVACSDANATAVVDVSGNRSYVEGWIPTGWYPTGVRALASGAVVALNGKGARGTGSASWIDAFSGEQLAAWTKTAMANSRYIQSQADEPGPLPAIEHVIYITRGSRSYDQVFNANSTPNQHKLAREFATLDNFYANGDNGAEGEHWSTAAIANDFVTRLAPAVSARRRTLYDFEGLEPTAQPPAGYLWTNAAEAGLAIRNFGHFVENKPNAPAGSEQVAAVHDPVLARFTNRFFRGDDPTLPDTERAKVFLSELADYEKSGAMPRLILMRLANDSAASDGDSALGTIVEAVSRSRSWPSTAIFVAETSGSDNRAPAFVISPYVKRHIVDSTMYNTTSMLRTIELLLGLRPMTQFDAAARPMTALFQSTPDASPYRAEKAPNTP